MEQIKVLNLSIAELKLEEFLQYGNDLIKVVKKSNVSDLGLTTVLTVFEGNMRTAENFGKDEQKTQLGVEIEALRTERDKRVVAVSILMRGYKQASAENVKQAVALAVPMLEVFFNGYVKSNQFVKDQRLKMLFAKILSDADFANALKTIGLKTMLDEVDAIEQELIALVMERRAPNPETDGQNTNTVTDQAAYMLRKLLSSVETNAMVMPLLDFKPLIAELNATTAAFKKVIVMRRAQRKLKASAKNATASEAATTETVKNEAVLPSNAKTL